jgi:uncharacterized protein (DUF2249 family)
MRKLSPEEFAQLPIKGKGRSSVVFNSLINLKEGEGLLIEQKDWNRKAAPSALVRYIEKKYSMRFSFGALANGAGWAVQRIDEKQDVPQKIVKQAEALPNIDQERFHLKSELTLYYLGRISLNKIERIEDTIKAATIHFWNTDKKLIHDLFHEIILVLQHQGHIVVENEKTYVPLKR